MMITLVNEPKIEYNTSGWIPLEIKFSSFDENISDIGNNSIFVNKASGPKYLISSIKPKIRLSLLRGKMTKHSEREIDAQITDLRNEWERNI